MRRNETDFKRIICIAGRVLLMLFFLTVYTNTPLLAQHTYTLPLDSFISQVKKFHPVSIQANNLTEMANASLTAARGSFDPNAGWNRSAKTLDGTSYYEYSNAELKVPTITGVTVKAGYENSRGKFINPELTNGIASYLGIELPVLQGLLTDKKRTALRQAKIYVQQTEQERRTVLNDLLVDAYTTYFEWATAFRVHQLYEQFADIAQKRARLISIAFTNGDRSAADTIEAEMQWRNYRMLASDAWLQVVKKSLNMADYLWSEEGSPYLLSPLQRPDTTVFSTLNIPADTTAFVRDALRSHPILRGAQFKIDILEAERKLKMQNLLPSVNLQANLLSKEYFQYKNLSQLYLENNYKWGIQIGMPLFFRQARGEYKNTQLKLKNETLILQHKAWQIQNKLSQYYAEAKQTKSLLTDAGNMLSNGQTLLKAEELRFTQGDSSIFLVNTREMKVVELYLKVIDYQLKYAKAFANMQWAAGVMN